MSKIALFFGSFNPIHYGHLAIAEYLLENTSAQKIIMVVSPNNPFKGNIDSAAERLANAKQKVKESGLNIEVSDVEFHLPQPLYTIQTLTYLRDNNPDNDYVLVVGGDNIEELHRWYRGADIINNFEIWVYPRPGYNAEAAILKYNTEFSPKGITLFEARQYDISSTEIRNRKKQQKRKK